MSEDNKRYLLIGLGILVILVIVYFAWGTGKAPASAPTGNTALTSTPAAVTTSTPSATSTTTKPVAVKGTVIKKTPLISATQKYLDALKVYKTSGYYFQFSSCHALPGSLTLKAGKKFMLDNRDGSSRKIGIYGSRIFTVGAYGYVIDNAPTKAGTYYITCDGGGSATILVQN